jgi:hypothetical protein
MHNGAIMPSEVRHLVDPDQTYPLVRLAGVLDTDSAPEVRSALLDVLAGQPEAVVVDVGDLRVGRAEALGVLRGLRRDTADWPAARLVLCDPGDGDAWRDSGWPVWPDRAHAFAALGRPDRDSRLSLAMEPVLGAARRARELIGEACARWRRTELADPACIVATEMVNNVVAHARTPMIVLLATRGGGLSVAVRDQSAATPSFSGTPAAPTAYGGRGMLLIDSMASRWGNLVLDDGKVVWAVLDATPDGTTGDGRESKGMCDPVRG